MAEKAGDAIEFIEIPRIWSMTIEAELTEPKFWWMNVIARHESWDITKTQVQPVMQRKTGVFTGKWTINGYPHVVTPDGWDGFTIWRDTRTRHCLCTQEIRDVLEAHNIYNLRFRPVDPEGLANAGDWMS